MSDRTVVADDERALPPRFVGFLVGQLLRAGLFPENAPSSTLERAQAAQAVAREIVETWNKQFQSTRANDE